VVVGLLLSVITMRLLPTFLPLGEHLTRAPTSSACRCWWLSRFWLRSSPPAAPHA
jgi:hypothetical protein